MAASFNLVSAVMELKLGNYDDTQDSEDQDDDEEVEQGGTTRDL